MSNYSTTQLQGWLNEVIVCQGNMQHKLQQANKLYQLTENEVVASSRNVSVYSRIHVYTSGYIMRLLECISADFPVLQKFMGNEVFNKFASASLMWSPSTSYSLYDLGDNFIRFLESTRPQSTVPAATNTLLDLPIEIARAERARQQVLRLPGTEETDLQKQLFADEILFGAHEITLCTPGCLRLLELKFPLKHLFEQLNRDEAYTLPQLQQTYMVISRKNYRLQMEEIPAWQYHFLSACAAKCTVSEAIGNTARVSGLLPSVLMADLFLWLPIFCEKGYITLN